MPWSQPLKYRWEEPIRHICDPFWLITNHDTLYISMAIYDFADKNVSAKKCVSKKCLFQIKINQLINLNKLRILKAHSIRNTTCAVLFHWFKNMCHTYICICTRYPEVLLLYLVMGFPLWLNDLVFLWGRFGL